MPVYSSAPLPHKTLQAMQSQGHGGRERLVVAEASTNGSLAVVAHFGLRASVLTLSNAGVSGTRYRARARARARSSAIDSVLHA